MELRVEKGLYILNDAGEPVHVTDPVEWATWFEANKFSRHVGDDRLGDMHVSTVFLAIDEAYGNGTPVLYETRVFGGPLDQKRETYHTKADAAVGHARWLDRVRAFREEMGHKADPRRDP
jgi:hypothetical protein